MTAETEKLLAEFAARRGLARFQPDAMGHHVLMIDDWAVRVFQVGRSLYLEAMLGGLPPERPSAADPLLEMLGASLAGLARDEEVLSLDIDTMTAGEDLCLYRVLPLAALDAVAFEQALDSFVNRLDHWSNVFTQAPSVSSSPAAMHILYP